jgi:hypothetical protein
MNTVGKTLVIINLIIALVVAGFLVIDFARRENWKREFDKLKTEFDAAHANTNVAQDTNRKLLADNAAAQGNLTMLEKKFKSFEQDAAAKEEKLKRQSEDDATRAKNAELQQLRINSENERLQAEIKDLIATLKKREQDYLALQDKANKNQQIALQREQEAKSANERSLNLLDQLRQKELLIAKLQDKGGGTTTPGYSPRSPDYRNPPQVYVKGVVTKVSAKDANLAQISIGSDEGLKENHTLEVFRLTPRPEYVGTMRLTYVDHHSALGQLLRPAGLPARSPLKEGDEVATNIIR